MMKLGSPFSRSPEKGAETGVYLCTSPEVANTSGGYFFDMKKIEPSAAVFSPGDAQRLWDISLSLAGLDNEDSETAA